MTSSGFIDADSRGGFTGVKVFSATMKRDRDSLGDRIMAWIRQQRDVVIVAKVVTLSSDASFHCLTITIFYRA